jgi:hypothetical protein
MSCRMTRIERLASFEAICDQLVLIPEINCVDGRPPSQHQVLPRSPDASYRHRQVRETQPYSGKPMPP